MDEFTLYGLSMVTGMAYVVFEFYSFLIMLCLAIVGGIIFALACSSATPLPATINRPSDCLRHKTK